MDRRFLELNALDWREMMVDSGRDDWRANWFLDGCRAQLTNTSEGMVFGAGPVVLDHASHAVLWTKQSFSGEIKIEWDYTRLDTIAKYVNIIYIQATGTGGGSCSEDIKEWASGRQIPYMKSYFENMNLLHVSYAAHGNNEGNTLDQDYVRARRYPVNQETGFAATSLPPDYFDTGLFHPGLTYHFTFIKTGNGLFFQVTGDETERVFAWDLDQVPPVTHGRIGIRHMWTRCSRYANIRISTLR